MTSIGFHRKENTVSTHSIHITSVAKLFSRAIVALVLCELTEKFLFYTHSSLLNKQICVREAKLVNQHGINIRESQEEVQL